MEVETRLVWTGVLTVNAVVIPDKTAKAMRRVCMILFMVARAAEWLSKASTWM